MCEAGATIAELAKHFNVAIPTIYVWKQQFPEFAEALKNWKASADSRVETSLFMRATGFEIGDTYYPPDTTSMIFWLKNRQPDQWRDRSHSEVTNTVNMGNVSDADRIKALEELVAKLKAKTEGK